MRHLEEYKVRKITSCLQGICSVLEEKQYKSSVIQSNKRDANVIREMQVPCNYREGKDLYQLGGSKGSGKAF